MEHHTLQDLAAELLRAEDHHTPVETISSRYPNASLTDAYAIQQEILALKKARGERIIGHKIGLTSKAVQKQLDVYQPDYGTLTDANLHVPGSALSLSQFIAPQLEAELAFHLKEDISEGPVSSWQLLNAIAGVSPAFEIVDTRYGHYQFSIVDTVADNASYGSIVLGNVIAPLDKLELDCIGLNISCNGHVVKTATSAEVMGNPLNALLWLVNQLLALGTPLQKDDVILSGSFTSFVPCNSGDFYEARFAGLGTVHLHITD